MERLQIQARNYQKCADALKKLGIEENDQAMLRRFIGPPLDESFEKFYGFDKEKSTKGS